MFILVAASLIIFLIGKLIFGKSGSEVYVTVDNEEVYSAGLYSDKIVLISDGVCRELAGESEFDGTGNLLFISNGEADMLEADCRDRICVDMKPISHIGEAIVCLPHGVIVSVR